MGDARDPSVPPRGSVPPAKPLATITGPANRKPAAQTLVGYEAPSPDTLIGYEAPQDDDAPPPRASAPSPAKPVPKPVPRASVPPPVARTSAAPARADVTAKGRSSAPSPVPKGPPPRTSAAPVSPMARTSAPPPPPRPSAPSAPPPLQNDELDALDAVLATPARKDPSIEMLTSQELVLEADPIKPPRIDQTEELTNLEVERLSITPPPVPAGRAVRTSMDDIPTIPTQGRGWVLIGIPVVLAAVAGLLYFAMREETPAPTTAETTEAAAAPTTPTSAAAAPTPSAAAPAAVTPTPAAPTPAAPTPAAATPAAATPAPAAATPAPAAAGLFDAARLAELAPLPEVPARTARLRESARASRAERALSNASREMRRDDYEDARAAYNSALTYMPENTDAMVGLARIAVAEEAWDKALAWTQRAMVIAPRDVDILLLRGDAQLGAGDRDAARATWQQVLEIDPRNRDARSRMRRRARRR